MRFFFGCAVGIAASLAAASVESDANACPPLPPGLIASVRPLNLTAPIPANGAVVFLLECWHDCTPCAAAEQRLDISVVDGRGRAVRGDKPEQVFLSESGSSHLVLWRPADAPPPGDYAVTVGVRGQSETDRHPFSIVAPIAEPNPSSAVTATLTTYRVDRGTIYSCDQSQTDCDYSSLGFGSQYEQLPELDLSFGSSPDQVASGQLLYHVVHHSADGTTHWGSWRSASDAAVETVRYAGAQSEYCADTEVRSLLTGGSIQAESPCQPHGDLQAPLTGDTDLTSSLETCMRPPTGLEPEWCAIHSADCSTNDGSIACQEVATSCVDPIERGTVSAPTSYRDATSIEADEQCASPTDPYDESVAGCTCRATSARAPKGPLWSAFAVVMLGLMPTLRRLFKPSGESHGLRA